MAIRINGNTAEPLTEASARLDPDSKVNIIESDAGVVLRLELERYCRRQVNGRSFLIAGHRGAGKTTTVADALERVLLQSSVPNSAMLRPLPVFLHGPSLFAIQPQGASKPRSNQHENAREQEPTQSESDRQGGAEEQAEMALQQIILGLHRAVAKEFARAYRERLVNDSSFANASALERLERAEGAAQFEIELAEDPSAARLREFWDAAHALDHGLLFATPHVPDQGARELVALNGMCSAHQRISGHTDAQDKRTRSEQNAKKGGWGISIQTAELVKPVVSVLAGAGVAGGAAAGAAPLGAALLSGALAILASALVFKSASLSESKVGRQLDTVFIPDLTLKTLDRVLPTLLDRLRAAGLAPVLVIDELDKVRGLPDRLVTMIQFMKKLLAENAVTCFLTDRGYMEHLREQSRETAYGLAYSYFSIPLLVTYHPDAISRYLEQILTVDSLVQTGPQSSAVSASPGQSGGVGSETDQIDLELLPWVLRQRCQLHALTLAREISLLRGVDGTVQLAPGALRTDTPHRLQLTFQVAIELQLWSPRISKWLNQRPDMAQTLLDALYFAPREWMSGGSSFDVGTAGMTRFTNYLTNRMNLHELHAPAGSATSAPIAVTLSQDDLDVLWSAVVGIFNLLRPPADDKEASVQWERVLPEERLAMKSSAVWDALLRNEESLLTRQAGERPGARPVWRWRYAPSSTRKEDKPDQKALEEAQRYKDSIRSIEERLATAFELPPGEARGIFEILQDRDRVLPTTPAWARVQAAIDNLDSPWRQTTSWADIQAIQAFDKLLENRGESLVKILTVVSALAGVRSNEIGSGGSALQVLYTLSRGLAFQDLDTEGVVNAATAALNDIADAYKLEELKRLNQKGAPDDRRVEISGDELLTIAAAVREQGRLIASKLHWKQIQIDAWEATRKRLLTFTTRKTETPLGPSELLCAVGSKGPSHVPPRLGDVELWEWSGLLLRSLPGAGADALPPWLGSFCLRHLGASTLTLDEQDRLVQWLKTLHGDALDAEWAVQVLSSGGPPSEDSVAGLRCVVCIEAEGYPQWYGWKETPRSGLILFLESKDLQTRAADLRHLKGALPIPSVVAACIGDSGTEKEVRERVTQTLGSDQPILWTYFFRKPRQLLKPNIDWPRKAADLFTHNLHAANKARSR